jgi:uncharacterized protein (DUF1684 family)
MRLTVLLIAGLVPVTALAGGVQTAQQYWKSQIEDANKHYSETPHAILKIQDAAYMRDGDTQTLVGTKGKPESYHWVKGTKAKGVLIAGVRGGHPFVVKDKQLYADAAIGKGIPVDADVDIMGQQTQVDAGVIGARIWVFNQKNPAAKAFTGLSYFPYDPSFVVNAHFTPDAKLSPRTFRTSRGTDKQFYHAGDATFALKGKTFTLPFFAETNVPGKITSMSAFFTDGLTGRGAYGAGRYVDVDTFGTYPPKTLPIDFNFAYNPNCARSAYYTCPVALDTIAMDIRAGERDPHAMH